ncbi:PREDICTED: iduronate 2-sulfatase-like [Amphimedon queenslandica]|uniref:Sulfatase N-terminal domain-containing protein n=1 Tax=Amphimedon queenslandica TaxID=400682 RepID=A0AAN0JEC9_AMPQE|nr:PREDICTED: iduronate 2-sulfatase-like [Amphimedon queenslandica]|eukprot:XP_019855131.1 PREDICTED: iduronate 2-sulfatase-like [Amphimedon queenslandica]
MAMQQFSSSLLFLLVSFILATNAQKKNVLFIAVDDLRPELNAYGFDFIKSPNIDNLASKSMLFERAYCQIAVCSPSRASLLTGRRPDTNHVWKIANDEYWRTVPDSTNGTTIPQYFKENGYISIGMGKLFHPGPPSGNDDEAYSWSPEGLPYFHADQNVSIAKHAAWYDFDQPDNYLQDGKLADNAVSVLKQLEDKDTTGEIVAVTWSINEEWKWFHWRTQEFIIKSEHEISSHTKWTNGKCQFKEVVQKPDAINGRIEGNFMRGIHASITAYTQKKIKYASEIENLKKKIETKNKSLTECKDEWEKYRAEQKESLEEIELLEKYIAQRRTAAEKCRSNLMTMEDAATRLEELKGERFDD